MPLEALAALSRTYSTTSPLPRQFYTCAAFGSDSNSFSEVGEDIVMSVETQENWTSILAFQIASGPTLTSSSSLFLPTDPYGFPVAQMIKNLPAMLET